MDNPEPQRAVFQEDDELGNLAHNVSEALRALPIYFRTATRIEGLDVGDLFSLSGVLGSSIESQVVETLNGIREVWDPDDRWPRHRFVRFAQTFPDVRLMTTADEGKDAVALGLELKGWYLLAKEREPSFRYQVTPAACSPYDLLVVVPWHLKNVLSGEPLVYAPYIEQARYVAEYRNWWWTNVRKTNDAEEYRRIHPPGGPVRPYPPAKSNIADRPAKDGGSNFGRIARLTETDGRLHRRACASNRSPVSPPTTGHCSSDDTPKRKTARKSSSISPRNSSEKALTGKQRAMSPKR